MIGLLGGRDSQLENLKTFLPESSFTHINTESFPESVAISIDSGNVEFDGLEKEIDIYYVDAYHSSVKQPLKKKDESQTEVNRRSVFANAEKDSFLRSLLKIEQEKGKVVVNGPDVKDFHYLKPFQLYKLQSAGLPVPDSIHTNDPEGVRGLFDHHDELVYKPVGSLSRVGVHDLEDFESRKSTLERAPVTFQEVCEGENLRAYVVDGDVVGCYRVLTEDDVVDYRGFETNVESIPTSERIAHVAIEATDALGMKFAGVDLIRSNDRIVLLECNSGPHFAGVESYTNTNEISQALANFLIDGVD